MPPICESCSKGQDLRVRRFRYGIKSEQISVVHLHLVCALAQQFNCALWWALVEFLRKLKTSLMTIRYILSGVSHVSKYL